MKKLYVTLKFLKLANAFYNSPFNFKFTLFWYLWHEYVSNIYMKYERFFAIYVDHDILRNDLRLKLAN